MCGKHTRIMILCGCNTQALDVRVANNQESLFTRRYKTKCLMTMCCKHARLLILGCLQHVQHKSQGLLVVRIVKLCSTKSNLFAEFDEHRTSFGNKNRYKRDRHGSPQAHTKPGRSHALYTPPGPPPDLFLPLPRSKIDLLKKRRNPTILEIIMQKM